MNKRTPWPALAMILALILLTGFISSCSTLISATRSNPIAEDYGKRSFGSFIDDALIETKAAINLKKTDKRFSKIHFSITSFNGIVLITGQVPTEELILIASDVVQTVRKVKHVHNELKISGPISLPARSNDSWLTLKVKSKLLASTKVKGQRVKVVTENGVVHLLGLVTHSEADQLVDIVRGTFGIQKIVRAFEYQDSSALQSTSISIAN